jgi:hypothetical protein
MQIINVGAHTPAAFRFCCVCVHACADVRTCARVVQTAAAASHACILASASACTLCTREQTHHAFIQDAPLALPPPLHLHG